MDNYFDFLFQVANNLRFSQDGAKQRKGNYLKARYNHFKKRYGILIKTLTKNEILECITYAVLIYEDFNRPKIARFIEETKFRLTKKSHTLGVMQVKTDKLISNIESVKLGTQKIVDAYNEYLENLTESHNEHFDWYATSYIIENYNKGTSYSSEMKELTSTIKYTFYKETKDTLDPRMGNAL